VADISAKAAGGLRRHWKAVLWIIGAPSVIDIIKEWGRGRVVEWLVAHLGPLGRWLAENPFAFFTLGLFSAMLFLAISVVHTELNPPASVIVDVNRRPYVSPPRIIETLFIVAVMGVFWGLTVYGALKYWAIRTTPSVAATVEKKLSNAPQTPAAIEEGVHPIPVAKPTKRQNETIETSRGKNESSQKQPPDVAPKTVAPSPSQQAPISSPSVPTSAPAAIIPSDPVKAVQTVDHMRNSLAEVLGKKETITFLMSWTGDDPTFMAFISQLLSSACRTTPRQCWFTQASGNERDLDRPPIQESGRRGITIYGNDAVYLAIALGGWFTTYDTSSIPDGIEGYKDPATKELIWIEIGPGSPWKQPAKQP
jgi:hypothetical protein